MSGAGCQPRKMMGRGPEGGCGAEEKPCPVSRPSSSSSSSFFSGNPSVGYYTQALKALSERSPFDADEALARPSTLPTSLAAVLVGQSDGRRKHRKSHGEAPAKPLLQGHSLDLWAETEEYFRPVTVADVDALVSRVSLGSGPVDSCLTIPLVGSGEQEVKKDEALELVPVEVSSSLEPVVVMEEAEKEDEKKVGFVEVRAEEGHEAVELDEVVENEGDERESSSIHWLLGSKHRCLLASERPNKKRKLLGEAAGLDRVLSIPNLQAEGSLLCDVCCSGESNARLNRLLTCNSCQVAVHQKCYGVHEVEEEAWLCSWCRHLDVARKSSKKACEDSKSRPCVLCAKDGGALKPTGGESCGKLRGGTTKFAHLFCSLWAPEVTVEDVETMEPLMNVEGIQDTRKKLVCNVCKVKQGVCVRCSHGTCRTSFHPVCAREANHRMEIWGKISFDNVELRAFCSKHSSFKSSVRSENSEGLLTASVNSSVSKPLPATLSKLRLSKLGLSQKNRNIILTKNKAANSGSEKLDKNETILEEDTVNAGLHSDSEAQQRKNADANGDIDFDTSVSTSLNLAVILRKLIDRGKINVIEFASEMGISSASLEAALVGETSSFSPGLRSKIIKWLQDSAHIPCMGHLKRKSGSTLSSSSKLSMATSPDTGKVTDPYVPVTVTGLDSPDAVLVKSLPPRRRTKSSIRILKDNKTLCSSGETFIEKDKDKLAGEIAEIPVELHKDASTEVNGKKSHTCDQDFSELKSGDNNYSSNTSSFLTQCSEENPAKWVDKDLLAAQLQPQQKVDGFPFVKSGIDQADDAIVKVDGILKKDNTGCPGHDVDVGLSGTTGCKSCIHQFIQMRLKQLQDPIILKHEDRDVKSNGGIDIEAATTACVPWNQQNIDSICTETKGSLSAAKNDQITKAKTMGILDLSPKDEVEGEILYLQAKLLDNAIASKQRCDDLLFNIVRSIPQEMDAMKKQRWDLVLVNQYLREVREAKKRGRRERRHREAQAVLAAAAAAAAASSRNSSLRKDTADEIISIHQESTQKISSLIGRTGCSHVSHLNETSRASSAKISSDKHSDIFQLADILKGNTLFCDVCRRTETISNRIFVCSSCKVAVHLDCYRKLKDPIGSWKCELCEEFASQSRSPRCQNSDSREMAGALADCGLCGGTSGAFRKTADGRWVHAFCAEWLLESTFKRGQQNPVGLDTVFEDMLSCSICHHKVGACVKCSYGQCQIAFHPTCARNVGLYMNVKIIGGKLQHKAYCEKHSMEQRKVDTLQHGAEELNTMKQIRVELEKVRLLCERIVKREKLKRDLVLCSHKILASRRDTVAFSVLVRSSFFQPGVSSDSGTTSINKSHSGTLQRSDDITVDSVVSGRRVMRLPLRRDVEGKTDDSSTSPLTFKRKLADRTSFSGKKLPQRPISVALRNSKEDGEHWVKARKHTEMFQKELLMTSDEASMQNQRLPKGFAYVPVRSISNKKPPTSDSVSSEPRGPSG